jgi:hypothetical protein
VPGPWRVLLSSEESRSGGCGEAAVKPETREAKFRGAETLLLQKQDCDRMPRPIRGLRRVADFERPMKV